MKGKIMKKTILAFAVNLVFVANSFAADATATITKQFYTSSSMEKIADFIENNKDEIRNASGLKTLEKYADNQYKVQRNSLKGNFVWITKESKQKKSEGYVFKSELVKSVEGGMTNFMSTITLRKVPNYVLVEINSTATVDNPKLKTPGLQIDISTQVNKVETYLKRNLK